MFNQLTTSFRASTNGNLADTAYLRWLVQDTAAQETKYKTYRDYYNGDHNVPLTDRQEEYLGLDGIEWRENYLPLPISAVNQRLAVESFDCEDEQIRDVLLEWWNANNMDANQKHVTQSAQIDGDTYVLVEWNVDNGQPVISHERAYENEDGEGMRVHYKNSDRRSITFASKRWRETEENGTTYKRLNIYTPDFVYKYRSGKGNWEPIDTAVWPEPWFGVVTVEHFRHDDDGSNWGKSELDDLIPIQQRLNKSVLDLIEGADKTAFQVITLAGAAAIDKDGNPIKIKPGQILWVNKMGASWGFIPPADIEKLIKVKDNTIMALAQVSQNPVQYFQVTGQIASSDTQKADDSQLVAKVKDYSVFYGNSWENVMRHCLRLSNEFGGTSYNVDTPLSTVWGSFERVDVMAENERKANQVNTLVSAGSSLRGAMAIAGYTEEQIVLAERGDIVDGITQ